MQQSMPPLLPMNQWYQPTRRRRRPVRSAADLLAGVRDRLKPGRWDKGGWAGAYGDDYDNWKYCLLGHLGREYGLDGRDVADIRVSQSRGVRRAMQHLAEVIREQFPERVIGKGAHTVHLVIDFNDNTKTTLADVQLVTEKALIRAAEEVD